MSLNGDVKVFVQHVSKAIPVVDGKFCVHVITGDELKEVYFNTAREAAAFMAGVMSVTVDPAIVPFV